MMRQFVLAGIVAASSAQNPSWSGIWSDGRRTCSSVLPGPSPANGTNMTVSYSFALPSSATGAAPVSVYGPYTYTAVGQATGSGSWVPAVYALTNGSSTAAGAHTGDAAASGPGLAWHVPLPPTWTGGYPEAVLTCDMSDDPTDGALVVLIAQAMGQGKDQWTGILGMGTALGDFKWHYNTSKNALYSEYIDATCAFGYLIFSFRNGYIGTIKVSSGDLISWSAQTEGYVSIGTLPNPMVTGAAGADSDSKAGAAAGQAGQAGLRGTAKAVASADNSHSHSTASAGLSYSPSLPCIVWSDQWGVAAFDGIVGNGGWNASGLSWAIVGNSAPISPDGAYVVLVNYTGLVALRMGDGSLAWSWPWPDGLALGGSEVLLAWANGGEATGGTGWGMGCAEGQSQACAAGPSYPSGVLVFATNLAMTASPFSEFGYVAAIDGQSGKTLANLQMNDNTMLGAGNLAVDTAATVVYATTWVNPSGPGALGRAGRGVAQGSVGRSSRGQDASPKDKGVTAPIPTTLVTRFSIDTTAGTITAQSWGRPVYDGNLGQTYALGPSPGQLTVLNGTAIQVLVAGQ